MKTKIEIVGVEDILAALQAGRFIEAESLCEQYQAACLAAGADASAQADVFHLRGMALREQGRLSEALEAMRRAADLDASNAMLWLHIAQLEQRIGDNASAIASLRRALEMNPGMDEAWFTLGELHSARQEWHDVVLVLNRLFALPALATQVEVLARNRLGLALMRLGKAQEALVEFERVLALDARNMGAQLNAAQVYRMMQRPQDALRLVQGCVAQFPDEADALIALAESLAEMGNDVAALQAMRRALALAPKCRQRFARRLHQLERQLCDWSDFEASRALCVENAQIGAEEMGDIFSALAIPGLSRALQRRCAERWAASIESEASSLAPPTDVLENPRAHGRLRIGYLSADLHDHPTAWLMAEVFELHDRAQFEIYAYSMGKDDGSPMRQRLYAAFDVFREVRGLELATVVDMIRHDNIDILIDLKGYTQDARPEILAARPAPLQVSYLGYPGTMGARFIDYLLADEHVVPKEHAADYSEHLVYLPASYQCNDRQRKVAAPLTRQQAGLPEDALVLCCFNTNYKLTPEMFALWCAIVRDVPGSVLWVLQGSEEARTNLTAFAEAQGLPSGRLIFAPKLPHAEHLARLALADLFLDTLPYNAHTTASDALWVSVPVITCAGDTFAGRVASSLLHAVGLSELVTQTLEEYQRLVKALAHDRVRLKRLKQHLRAVRLQCPLFDSEAFSRDLESAYRQMWTRHEQGLPPAAFSVLRRMHRPSSTPMLVPDALGICAGWGCAEYIRALL